MSDKKKIIYADDLLVAIRDDHNINGANFARIRRHIDAAPAVEAVPVMHGRWEKNEKESEKHTEAIYFCSVCRNHDAWGETEKTNYCPNCGAKMDLEG